MNKKIKILVASLMLSVSITSQAQLSLGGGGNGGILGMMARNPIKTGVGVGLGAMYLESNMHIARDLSYHLQKVAAYFNLHPEKFHPIADYVLNALAHPANKADYDRYYRLAEVMGLENIPPYLGVENGPTILTHPGQEQDPNAGIYTHPAHLQTGPNIIYTPEGEAIDTRTEFPNQEVKSWEDYVLLKNQVHSKELAKNMANAGMGAKPYWYSAHHIVAWDDPRAANSRALLSGVNIDIDDAVNGVYLPQKQSARQANDNSTLHPEIHTDNYYQEIERRLAVFNGDPVGMKQELKNIAQLIKQNQFPY
jgi:hypothetical protein